MQGWICRFFSGLTRRRGRCGSGGARGLDVHGGGAAAAGALAGGAWAGGAGRRLAAGLLALQRRAVLRGVPRQLAVLAERVGVAPTQEGLLAEDDRRAVDPVGDVRVGRDVQVDGGGRDLPAGLAEIMQTDVRNLAVPAEVRVQRAGGALLAVDGQVRHRDAHDEGAGREDAPHRHHRVCQLEPSLRTAVRSVPGAKPSWTRPLGSWRIERTLSP